MFLDNLDMQLVIFTYVVNMLSCIKDSTRGGALRVGQPCVPNRAGPTKHKARVADSARDGQLQVADSARVGRSVFTPPPRRRIPVLPPLFLLLCVCVCVCVCVCI